MTTFQNLDSPPNQFHNRSHDQFSDQFNDQFRDRLPDTFEGDFTEAKPLYTEGEATLEANRCLYCADAPCIRACPTEINIPQFISRIGTQDIRGAAQSILNSNIMGLSCALSCPTEVLCEGACVVQNLDHRAIPIGRLQRFALEKAYSTDCAPFFTPAPSSGFRIALLGAGPASLACAHELRKFGHETLIFEKKSLPGGLGTYGIAPYKMKVETSLKEIEQILAMGIEIRYEQELGRNLRIQDLLEDFDALFLGMGLGEDHLLQLKGRDPESTRPRILGATDFILGLKTHPKDSLGWLQQVQAALVVGGGNTALDVCRELKVLKIPKVIMSYRKGPEQISGYAHELKAARQEGVEFKFHTLPVEVNAQSQVILSETQTRVGEKRFQTLTVDLVITAIGQSQLESLLSQVPGLVFHHGCLEIHPKTGQTGHSKIYAGGDLTSGGKEIVNAVAEGKRAAQAIHENLKPLRKRK